MSSIRTQFKHKSIMLGILFLGALLNSQYDTWNSSDADTDQVKNPSIDAQIEQSHQSDESDHKKENGGTSIASYG